MSDIGESRKQARTSIQFPPLRVPKASDVLANELRERILTGELAEGIGLPAERDLVVQTRMSRTTVREALRILEVQGLVTIRTGRTGGAFVRQPGVEAMASTVNLLIRGRGIRLAALLETREAIEPFCAQLAAQNRTAEELAVLEAAIRASADDSDDLAHFIEHYVAWHLAVARASHNELLFGVMSALSRAIYEATDEAKLSGAEIRSSTVRAHESITAAIRDQNGPAALRRMTRHVHSYAAEVLRNTRN
jgi:GntR family transcriptional repressor for pyruvate dehydrogenase complex